MMSRITRSNGLPQPIERDVPVADELRRPAFELQVQPDEIADVRLVLHHQHRARVARV